MAKAALVSVDLDTGEVMCSVFSNEDYQNPSQIAINVMENTKHDFPTFQHAIIEDDDSKEIRVTENLKQFKIK